VRAVIVKKSRSTPQGLLKRDKLNPDSGAGAPPSMRPDHHRNLHPTDHNHWEEGWFYDPDDASTYKVKDGIPVC
jgi:hypothetical protein